MLLASHIGFLALVGPAQFFYALSFDPQRRMESNEKYISFMIKGNIYQCLINTYYAASFVFCFASSSMFRREIAKLLNRSTRAKNSIAGIAGEPISAHENRPFLHGRASGIFYSNVSPNEEYVLERSGRKRATESNVEVEP